MLLAVILVCATTIAPADCTRTTALDVRVLPAHSPLTCMMGAQATLAREGDDWTGRYAKTVCERRKA